jgi:hypothetical protein
MNDDILASVLKDKEKEIRAKKTKVFSQEEIDSFLAGIDPGAGVNSVNAEKRRFLTFADLAYAEDSVIRQIAGRVNINELAKALIRESAGLRRTFYRNMSFDGLKILDGKLRALDTFEIQEKTAAQRKILVLAAKARVYAGFGVEERFDSAEEFAAYLTWNHPPERLYGYGNLERDVTMCRFSATKGGENLLADIERKNKSDGMGNAVIPGTNITLINFSVCPKCGHVFSFKDLRGYYLHPRPDPAFKNTADQFRNDTRVFCAECGTYFIPSLVIADGIPKTETQFLCRTQTMHAIEDFYRMRGIKVLSRNRGNIVRRKKKCMGILNDVLLKEMESKPALISNLLQYTPPNLALNLLDGSNVRKGDLLYGSWEYRNGTKIDYRGEETALFRERPLTEPQ